METPQDNLLARVVSLCADVERTLAEEIVVHVNALADTGREGVDQRPRLDVVVEATAELRRVHELGVRCRTCAARMPAGALDLDVCIVGSVYEDERLRGLLDGLRGAKPLDRKPSGTREAAWDAGVRLGVKFRRWM